MCVKPQELVRNLRALVSFEELEQVARETQALTRVRKLHPVEMLEAMLATMGHASGRLADAMRYLERERGIKVHRASFYKRLDEDFARFVHVVMERVLASRAAAEHPKLQGVLEGFRDLWAWDSTSVTLRQKLAHVFSKGSSEGGAGAKMHAAISLRSHLIVRPKLTAQRTHDAAAIDLGSQLEDVLVLLDRGYSGHKLFAAIAAGGGTFVTRLKTSTNPRIAAVHRADGAGGNAPAAAGRSLDEALEEQLVPMGGVVDLDVELSLDKRLMMPARVVGLPVENDGKRVMWWYLTNLPRTQYPAELLRDLYRLRWQVELLWKQLKGRFRLDDVEALTEHNVRVTMEAAVLAHALSLGVMHAVTTKSERKSLTLGMMALVFPYFAKNLVNLIRTDDEDQAREIARDIRSGVLHSARDTNPARTKRAAAKRAQRARQIKLATQNQAS